MRREFPASLYIQYVPRCSRSLAALISAMKRGSSELSASFLATIKTRLAQSDGTHRWERQDVRDTDVCTSGQHGDTSTGTHTQPQTVSYAGIGL